MLAYNPATRKSEPEPIQQVWRNNDHDLVDVQLTTTGTTASTTHQSGASPAAVADTSAQQGSNDRDCHFRLIAPASLGAAMRPGRRAGGDAAHDHCLGWGDGAGAYGNSNQRVYRRDDPHDGQPSLADD